MSRKRYLRNDLQTLAKHSRDSSPQSRMAGRIHFGPLDCWINDPCGLVYCEGVYHLFYQLNPFGTEWGNMHWGHAVSRNLLQWEHRPVALAPHPELGMAFTGSIVVDSGNCSGLFPGISTGFLALLTTARQSTDSDNPHQTQSIAYSCDRGETWRWYRKNPVIPNDDLRDFRDPKIIRHSESGSWVLSISAGTTIRFYRSENLMEWQWTSTYTLDVVPDVCECPNLIRFQGEERDVWALAYSLSHPSDGRFPGVRYVTGTFDGRRFHRDSHPERRLDHGPDFYALQNWYGLPGGSDPIVMAWANNPAYSHRLPAFSSGGTGLLTIPRRVSAVPERTPPLLRQAPMTEAAARITSGSVSTIHESGSTIFDSVDKALPFQLELRAEGGVPLRLAIAVEYEAGRTGGKRPTLSSGYARPPHSEGEYCRVLSLELDLGRGPGEITLTRDTSHMSAPEYMRERRTIPLPNSEPPFDLTAVIEDGIVELFAFDGTVTATYLLPDCDNSFRVRVSYDPSGIAPAIRAYTLDPATSDGQAAPTDQAGVTGDSIVPEALEASGNPSDGKTSRGPGSDSRKTDPKKGGGS